MNIFETLDKNFIEYENKKIHVIIDNNGELWFNANDIANALGYRDRKDAIHVHVDKQDMKQFQYINYDYKYGHPQSLYLNESGLYSLMLGSRMKNARKFRLWVTRIVLPNIRKYGMYKLKKEYEEKYNSILAKINFLEKENKKIKQNLKKEKYPGGGMVYVIDYSTEDEEIYRIGMTNNMNKRKKIYNTHTLNKHEVVFFKETDCPIKLESCIRSLLYDYRYQDNKDFYVCSLNKIKRSIKECLKSIRCIDETQVGGAILLSGLIESLYTKKNKIQRKIKKIDKNLSFIDV
jgi:prophage antirepressor-like protein